MSRSTLQSELPVEERVQMVLAVLGGEVGLAEAARRHGTSAQPVGRWRDRFIEAGKAGLESALPGPSNGSTSTERRLRAENEQLKLALAEAMVQLRVWQKGAEHLDQVPPRTSRP
ncbi:MAG: helix-turn-helix domain-containing protein [Jiangellaceae bacterium]